MANVDEILISIGTYRIWCKSASFYDLQSYRDKIQDVFLLKISRDEKFEKICKLPFVNALEDQEDSIMMPKIGKMASISRIRYIDWP